ncbi:MAG: response regulator [Clostridia bacterium]|jgi:CheY-like chemotaxis protein|nr:response regulator [Clostridia bacterium]
MVKTLIADDNIEYCKHIVNCITTKSNNLQVKYLATDGEETLKFLKKDTVDLLILDLKMPKLSGIEVLKKIKESESYGKPKVFLLSGDTELLNQALISLEIEAYSNKIEPIQMTYNKIQQIANEIERNFNADNVKNSFQKELAILGFNFKYKGTKYLLEAMIYIFENNDIDLLDNLEKYVYKVIAMQNHKSAHSIKTDITKACNLAYLYQEKNIIKDYFSLELKPTPKVIISTILTRYMEK